MFNQIFCSVAFIGLLASPRLFAQTDFLVNTKGDTLRGQISFQQVGQIEQALVKGKKRETISAIYVREVFLKGNRFKPVQFSGTVKFMQVLTEGYLSLLAFQPQGIMNYDGRLLQMRDGRSIEAPTIGFKKQMINFLKDCPALTAQIQEGTFDRKDLDKIIAYYNGYISEKTVSVQAQAKSEFKQTSKLEILSALKTEIEKSELESKQDALDMLLDMEEKIKGNKTIPPYLSKALKNSLGSRVDWIGKVEEILTGQ